MADGPQREKLKRLERLRRGEDFRLAYRAARSVADRRLVVHCRPNGFDWPRIGFVVGRKIGTAVVRNRVRRRLREALRAEAQAVPPGVDLVVVARAAARDATYAELRESLVGLVRRASERLAAEASLAPPSGGNYGKRGENN